jgi:hypothetical protein
MMIFTSISGSSFPFNLFLGSSFSHFSLFLSLIYYLLLILSPGYAFPWKDYCLSPVDAFANKTQGCGVEQVQLYCSCKLYL